MSNKSKAFDEVSFIRNGKQENGLLWDRGNSCFTYLTLNGDDIPREEITAWTFGWDADLSGPSAMEVAFRQEAARYGITI